MTALTQLLQQTLAFVPKLLGALLIVVVGYVVTRVVTTLLRRLLRLAGIDRLGARLQRVDVVGRSGLEISLATVLAQILYYFMMLVILVAATDVLGLEVVSNLVSSAIAYVPNLIAAIVILVIGAIVADVLRELTAVTCRSFGIGAAGMIGSLVFWFVFVAILVTALGQARLETDFVVINLSILLAGLALAFALAYGLAARPLMSGFLAQFYNRGKIHVGDRIRVDGVEGLIVAIDRASFTLESGGETVIVPLSKFQTETVRILERGPLHDKQASAPRRRQRLPRVAHVGLVVPAILTSRNDAPAKSHTMTPPRAPAPPAAPLTVLIAGLLLVASVVPLAAQKKEKEPVPDGWQIGAGLGADIGQLLLLNPRVGSGENRIGLGTNLTAYAKLKRAKLTWDNNFALNFAIQKLGAGVLPPIPGVAQTRIPYQKSIDELRLATQVGYSFSENSPWGYGLESTLLTQSTPTYQDSSGRNLLKDTDGNNARGPIAKFFSPATITAAPGITYRPDAHFDALISPASFKTIFVVDDNVRALPLYEYLDQEGDGERRLLQLGASIRANYSNKFLKDDRLIVKSTLGLFSNYLRNPQNVDLDWRNEFGLEIIKGLTVTLNAIALYDDDVPVQITDFDTVGGIVRDEDGEPVLGRRLSVTEQILIKYAVVF